MCLTLGISPSDIFLFRCLKQLDLQYSKLCSCIKRKFKCIVGITYRQLLQKKITTDLSRKCFTNRKNNMKTTNVLRGIAVLSYRTVRWQNCVEQYNTV